MNRLVLSFTVCLLSIFIIAGPSFGQKDDTPADIAKMIEKRVLKSQTRSSVRENPVQLIRTYGAVRKSDLLQSGIEIVKSLDTNYYIVSLENFQFLSDTYIKEQWLVNDLWKLQGRLLQYNQSGASSFIIHSDLPSATVHALKSIESITIDRTDGKRIYVRTNLENLIQHVITQQEVNYVGVEALSPQAEARVIDMNLNPNTINKIHHLLPELNGAGMTVSIQEPSYDKEDIDLKGRDIPSDLTSESVDRHSTEMATIVAGAGNSFITGKGVAWGTSITSSDFSDILPDADQAYRDLNTWVQNHSYGTVPESFYGTFAEAYDQSANNNPDLLHVFSAGNQAVAAGPAGVYEGVEGYNNITGNFKNAKNILVLGSVDTVKNTLPFSSRGPAYDGRVKPELVAYASVGTSNSAAIVSGVAILMQQAYLENNDAIPPSALVKAILINSAEDVGTRYVDFATGYGNVDAYRSVDNIKSERYFAGTINDDEEQLFTLNVPSNAENIKITLVWNDPAATLDASQALVNDLDMIVSKGSGERFLPWVLNSEPDPAKLSLRAVRKEDHLNNIEQVTIDNPSEEEYTISIKGFDVPEGPQNFYIAYQWDESNQFEWDYPTGSDNMPFNGESGSYFRWKSTLPGSMGILEYSIDNGSTWHSVSESVDLSQGFVRWEVPREINSKAIARMRVGGDTYSTEEFTISRPQRIQVGFNCGDSLLLQWNAIEGISQYKVFTYNDTSLENIRVTSDTAVVINTSEVPSNLVSLEPVFDDQKGLIRNEIIDYTFQGVACYVSFFFPEVVSEEGLYFNLQLGTTYQVDEIIFERKENEEWVSIGSIDVEAGDSAVFRFLDSEPRQGLNINRARILLVNGQQVTTDESQIFFLTDLPFVVFPNPVLRSDGINVFSKEFGEDEEVIFVLYDRTGKIVMRQEVLSDRENITFENVKRGMYIYNILAPGINFRGRVMVE